MFLLPTGRGTGAVATAVIFYVILLSLGGNTNAFTADEYSIEELRMDPEDTIHPGGKVPFEGFGSVALDQVTFLVASDATNAEGAPKKTYLDILLVKIEDGDCSEGRNGFDECRWTDMGIGYFDSSSTNKTTPFYCCSQEASVMGICSYQDVGRLIIDKKKFSGQALNRTIPSNAPKGKFLNPPYPPLEFDNVDEPGNYSLVFANCNQQYGRSVVLDGPTLWISVSEDIDRFFKESVPFYLVMMILYGVLGFWFGALMRQNRDSRIRLEECIFGLIILGFLEVMLKFIEAVAFEEGDSLGVTITIMAEILFGLKHGLSRCFLLLLSLGWGVVHASLDPVKRNVTIIITATYILCAAIGNIIMEAGSEPDPESMAGTVAGYCAWITFLIDFLFLIWIPTSLLKTIKYLRTTNQSRKLERYQSLLKILGLAIALTVLLIALAIADLFLDGGQEISILNISQGNEANFFAILTLVALLWKPNPMARDFAYAMEISGEEDDGQYGTADGVMNDLELTENRSGNLGQTTSDDSAEYKEPTMVQSGVST